MVEMAQGSMAEYEKKQALIEKKQQEKEAERLAAIKLKEEQF